MPKKLSMHPKVADLLNKIENVYERLRKSEQKVMDYLRNNPNRRLDYTITEFAKVVGVSETTISRATRELGYASYTDLKLSMAEGAYPSNTETYHVSEVIRSGDSFVEMGLKLSDFYTTCCIGANQAVESDVFDTCFEELRNAESIIIAGDGSSYSVCVEAVELFTRAGKNCSAYPDAYRQTVEASKIEANSVFIGISHSGSNPSLVKAMKVASSNDAKTIAITSKLKSPLGRAADHALLTWKSNAKLSIFDEGIGIRLNQLFVVNLLYLAFVNRDTDAVTESMEMIDDALNLRSRH